MNSALLYLAFDVRILFLGISVLVEQLGNGQCDEECRSFSSLSF